MDIKKLEQIAEYYGTEKSKYERNGQYSKGRHEVFTVQPEKIACLSFHKLNAGEVMAEQADKNGVVQSWDTYDCLYKFNIGIFVSSNFNPFL